MRPHRSAQLVLIALTASLVAVLAFPVLACAATPTRVSGLKAYASSSPVKATIKWSAAKYATSYAVYRSDYGVGNWKKIASGPSRSYTIPTAADVRYSYRVRAYSSRYRKYGAYSTSITPQPADLVGLSGDADTGDMSWTASEGASRYLISVTVGEDETLERYTAETSVSFASLVALFQAPGVVFEVTPESAAGVRGASLTWEAAGGSQDGGGSMVVGEGTLTSRIEGPQPGTYLVSLEDSVTFETFTVLLDGESVLGSDLNGAMTLEEFLAALDGNPDTLLDWSLVTSPKTEGTVADHYLEDAWIVVPEPL